MTPSSLSSLFARAPLVPLAIGITAGIVAERAAGIGVSAAVAAAAIGIAGWATTMRKSPGALWFLIAGCAGLGALHYRQYTTIFADDDIGAIAQFEPQLVQLRGRLADEPELRRSPRNDPLRSIPRPDVCRSLLDISAIADGSDWRPASGRVRLTVGGPLDGFHSGDEIEITGWLTAPPEPMNPGEFDAAGHARDERIRGYVSVRKSADAIVRLSGQWSGTVGGWLAAIRGWGRRTLEYYLPPDEAAVADALLLGDGTAMTSADWDIYIRTGVIHALAVSGQHLVILAAFLWFGLRLAGIRRKRGAWIVGLSLFAYALIAGGRPPALRAAVQVAVVCGAVILRRTAFAANGLALAWLVILLLKPTDVADAGTLLSFLCVAILTWGTVHILDRSEPAPLEKLIESSRPQWLRALFAAGRWILAAYGVTLVLGLAVMPLTATRYHLISPVGIAIGPPVIALTAIALVSGFLLLAASFLGSWAAAPFAWLTTASLAANSKLVAAADRIPFGHVYVGDVPTWWLVGCYILLFAAILVPAFRARWRTFALGGLAWFVVGLLPPVFRPRDDAMRMTFLAVGHGGCTVIETPDGRTILYDAGAISGPEVTARIIAPYLWNRGIRTIDDVLLSHADLDHFNGVPALLDRFRIGRIVLTPTFSEKPTPGVRAALEAIQRNQTPTLIVRAGDRLQAGDATLEVLHPPAVGPAGMENFRSMVVDVQYAGRSLVLTGDLQGPGLDMVLRQSRRPIDVLQAPHHGSRSSNTPMLADWAAPRIVVSCEGPPTWASAVPQIYAQRGARYFGTWPHGAVSFVILRGALTVETYRTRERLVVR